MNRIRVLLAALAVAVAAPGVAAGADEYVPFVTDFPTQQERYVPFVTDFPRPASPAPQHHGGPAGIDWSGVPAEAVAAAVAAALAATAFAVSRRRASEPQLGDC